ncbi:ornithine cyclodeaminase family protein [Bosea sp. NPDC055332]
MDRIMTEIVHLADIRRALGKIDLVAVMERAFAAYSRDEVTVPPVGELLLDDPPGEMHVKYGAIRGDDVFVVKLATGFPRNGALDLPPFGGVVLVFSAKTGLLLQILLDEGHLTNVRTAAAGAVAAKYLAPNAVSCIGICGSGVQARLQAQHLRAVTDCRRALVWARDPRKAAGCAADLALLGFETDVASSVETLAAAANLIVTTTAAEEPYLLAGHVRPGTHITAVGSDTPGKAELAADLLARADRVVVDSRSQSLLRGEAHHAIAAGYLLAGNLVELGEVITNPARGRSNEDQISIADLTGVAAQDIALAKAVCAELASG